jgi:tetratricopeptide (TPR) repeat protein
LRAPDVSLVVVVYNMAREAPRTLYSLSAAYQRHIAADDYEVIVVDNGSRPPFNAEVVAGLAGNFRLIRMDPAHPSPARAANLGLAEARGKVVGMMIDGARMVTPGLVHFARHGARLYERAAVTALTWHLGFDMQGWAIEAGYDKDREDALLASIDWPQDGYRLFEIATLAGSSTDGWFIAPAESNALFLRRETWNDLGGLDERFDAPGGGYVNADLWNRTLELPGVGQVILLGEGTFHQLHGGVATNATPQSLSQSLAQWAEQYEAIRGRPLRRPAPQSPPTYLGTLPRPALARFVRAALDPARARLGGGDPPLGADFDRGLWSLSPVARPRHPVVAALVELAHAEFRAGRFEAAAAVARLARRRAPDEPEPQRLLALVGVWLPHDDPPDDRRAEFNLALGEAHRLLGESEKAGSHYRAALRSNDDLPEARIGLSRLRMPGEDYLHWLRRLHAALVPETYLEIGIARGRSLYLAQPPTRAIGVDPQPMIDVPLKAETHIFCETSDEFFARDGLTPLLAGRPLALAFVDGAHVFYQSLKDFIHVEARCGLRSVVLLHDTVPLDEVTQRAERQRNFHTGDVWKTVLCLKHYRPELDIFTIATPWSGLTVITGLNPNNRVLSENYDDAIARFAEIPYAEIENRLNAALNIESNDWREVEDRLIARGVLAGTPSLSQQLHV